MSLIALDATLLISKYEKDLQELKKTISVLTEKLERHEKWSKYFADRFHEKTEKLKKENEMRKDSIEILDTTYDDAIDKIELRLKKTEEFNEKFKKTAHEDILKVHEIYTKLINRIEKLENNSSNEKSHKCPICDGNKVRIYLNTDVDRGNYKTHIQQNACHACEGKGIVWK